MQQAAARARTSTQPHAQIPRPFRVKLRGSVLALLRLPNQRMIRSKLHQLSITGGLLNLDQPLDEKLQLELIFHLGEVTIREKAEMMFPMWATQGWLQPFRFVDLPEAHQKVLESSLQTLLHPSQPDDISDEEKPAVKREHVSPVENGRPAPAL
jgi:hypothetical protein